MNTARLMDSFLWALDWAAVWVCTALVAAGLILGIVALAVWAAS